MKAAISLLAVLLLLSCASLAQTDSSKPGAASQAPAAATPTAASPPSTETTAASVGGASAAPVGRVFAPGATLFIAPMGGFEERVAYAIVKKKVPVVLVHEREKADFILAGGAHVHKRGFFAGFVLSTNGKGGVWITDVHTGNQVWAYKFTRVDAMTTVDQDYQNWADACAKHLKKTMEKK